MSPSKNASRLCLFIFLLVSGTAFADVLDDIVERGSIRIGVSEFVPWTMKDADGQLQGFEIDVGRKIAADIGVTAQFVVYDWIDIIPALQNGEIDLIAAGMAITPERALKVNFSRPIAVSGVGLALNAQLTENLQALSELNRPEVKISVVKGTLADSVARTLFDRASIQTFGDNEKAEEMLLENRAEAYVANMPAIVFMVLRNTEKVSIPINEPLVASSEALAVKKGEQELLNFLDAWVTARTSDKWLLTTRDYWFGTLDWASSGAE
ncbi:MAG: transporter substrate-binding domain-containing protein [Woeseiaceae bacterium]|nr:transporter substrate-binding domain-containing protein [Woeseiaceae bacterium]